MIILVFKQLRNCLNIEFIVDHSCDRPVIKKANVKSALQFLEPVTPADLEKLLRNGQSKGAAYIACSEMGWSLPCVPEDEHLKILIFQNIGCCLESSHGIEDLAEAEMISDIVVYGHFPCEFIKTQIDNASHFLDNPEDATARHFSERSTNRLKLFIQDNRKKVEYDALFRGATEQHLLDQIRKISTYQITEQRQPRLHAWLWLDDSKELLCFNGKTASFVKP